MTNLLFSFEGRINRAKFWLVHVAVLVVEWIVLAIIFVTAGMTAADYEQGNIKLGWGAGIVLLILVVLVVWIGLAVTAKRWHDRNKSAWWLLLPLVPLVGPIWAFIECGFLRGTAGSNNYGPDPLAAA